MSNGSTVQFDGFWERDSCARVRVKVRARARLRVGLRLRFRLRLLGARLVRPPG
jgi:hypothetical protein